MRPSVDVVELIHKTITRRYAFGVYRGRVEYNQDPLKLGRIKVRVPLLHGEYDNTPLDKIRWAWPAFPIESYQVPEVGDYVWVAFEGGDPDYPVYFGQWYPVHPQPALYGRAVGRRDLENKEDEWYPRPDRLRSLPDGYERTGLWPPELHLSQDLDNPRERIVARTPKGKSIYLSEQDGHEAIKILDHVGQGIVIEAPDARKGKAGDTGRQLEDAFEPYHVERPQDEEADMDYEPANNRPVRIALKTLGRFMMEMRCDPRDANQDTILIGKKMGRWLSSQGGDAYLELHEEKGTISIVMDQIELLLNFHKGTLSIRTPKLEIETEELVLDGNLRVMGDLFLWGILRHFGPTETIEEDKTEE